MMILAVNPFHRPPNPNSFTTPTAVAPLAWLSLDTTVSAGCDTIAQNTPGEQKAEMYE